MSKSKAKPSSSLVAVAMSPITVASSEKAVKPVAVKLKTNAQLAQLVAAALVKANHKLPYKVAVTGSNLTRNVRVEAPSSDGAISRVHNFDLDAAGLRVNVNTHLVDLATFAAVHVKALNAGTKAHYAVIAEFSSAAKKAEKKAEDKRVKAQKAQAKKQREADAKASKKVADEQRKAKADAAKSKKSDKKLQKATAAVANAFPFPTAKSVKAQAKTAKAAGGLANKVAE